jgi:hypothetical protein
LAHATETPLPLPRPRPAAIRRGVRPGARRGALGLFDGLDTWQAKALSVLGFYYIFLALDMILLRRGEITSSYIDEIFLLFFGACAAAGFGRLNSQVRIVLALYGTFTLICVVSAAFNGLERFDPGYPRWLAAFVGVLLDAKTIIAMLGFAYLIQVQKNDAAIRAAFVVLIGVVLANVPFLLRDIALGGSSLYGEALRVRNGFIQPQGFLLFVVDSADFTILASFAAAALYIGTMRTLWLVLWLGLSFLTLIHFSVKEAVAVVVCMSVVALTIPFKSAKLRAYVRTFFFGLAAVAAFPLVMFLLPVITGRLDEYVGGDLSDTVRTYSYVVALRIANDFFPLGSGSGTYASLPSRDYYFSPLYDIYGLSHMHGAARHFSGYLMDTFWPKILGEGGWFGFVAYLGMLGYICYRAVTNLIARQDGVNVFCVCVLITFIIKGFAASVMTQETFVLLMGFVFAYVLVHPVARVSAPRRTQRAPARLPRSA